MGKMVVFKVKELMESHGITRYKMIQLTNWNYKRINAFYFNKVKLVTVEEIEKLCEIFDCDIKDLIELKKK